MSLLSFLLNGIWHTCFRVLQIFLHPYRWPLLQVQYALPFDVLLTTYDIVLLDQDFLCQIPWHYTVIDEAQRLKNPSSVSFFILMLLV